MEASTNPDVKPNSNGQPSKKQKPTEYVILEIQPGDPSRENPLFAVYGGFTGGKPKTFAGVSKQAAIKEAETGPGTFIAVPARTFVPVKLVQEQKVDERFEDASF